MAGNPGEFAQGGQLPESPAGGSEGGPNSPVTGNT